MVAVVAIATAALAFGLNGAGASQTVVFVVSAVALAALATLIGQGTDQLGQRLGPATTGILQYNDLRRVFAKKTGSNHAFPVDQINKIWQSNTQGTEARRLYPG